MRALFPRGNKGSIAIEYALLLPALLMFVLGIMEVGRLMWTQVTLDRAVEAAARCGAVDQTNCIDTDATADYAVTQAYGLTITATAFTVTTPACGVSVSATFAYEYLIPWVATKDLVLHAHACYPTVS